jgi:hypothetical protein
MRVHLKFLLSRCELTIRSHWRFQFLTEDSVPSAEGCGREEFAVREIDREDFLASHRELNGVEAYGLLLLSS